MIQEAIRKLALRENLTRQEAQDTMGEIMSGTVSEAQIAGFLMGLRLKGETVDEITGCAAAMRGHAIHIQTIRKNVIDTCGTGGDGSGTFNISTCAAIIAAGAGAVVAKHGNRAVSSRSGSADVLRALGLNLDLSPSRVSEVLDRVGITFLFAPMLHGAMKYAVPVRRDLGIRTVFNILGPLTNPAGAKRQLLGVFDPSLTEPLASVLKELGSDVALVVHGEGGMDECSTAGATRISELREGTVKTYTIRASEFGFKPSTVKELEGGDAETNAAMIRRILADGNGPQADVAVLNAGAALLVAGLASDLARGITMAREAIHNGAAQQKLSQWIDATKN